MIPLLIGVFVGSALLIFRKPIGGFTQDCHAEWMRPMMKKEGYATLAGIVGVGWLLIAGTILLVEAVRR
jgi:multisubunit Na+/H+ antiporter MnhB subunit